MNKVKKLTKKELSKVQKFISAINKAQMQIGQIEIQKHQVLHEVGGIQTEFGELQNELEKKYGKVSINIEDGSLQLIEEGEGDEFNS